MASQKATHRAAWITLGLLFAGALYLCLLVLRPFAAPLLAGALVAILFYPLHRHVIGWMPRWPSLAALLSTAVIVFTFVIPIAIAISLAVQQLRAVFEGLGADGISDGATRVWASIEGPLDRVAGWFGTNSAELRQMLLGRLRELGAASVGFSVALFGGATEGVIKGVVAILTMFFSLRDGPTFTQAVVHRSPLGVARSERLCQSVVDTITASFYGVVAVAAVQGVLLWLGAWIAGLPAPILWGLGGGIASVLPLFGSSLAWLPGSIYLFTQGSIGMGVFLLIWGAVVVSNSDNIVRPLVLMSRVPANPLVVFIALLGGIQAFGLLGLLLGPVILGVTLTLIDMIREEIDDVHTAA